MSRRGGSAVIVLELDKRVILLPPDDEQPGVVLGLDTTTQGVVLLECFVFPRCSYLGRIDGVLPPCNPCEHCPLVLIKEALEQGNPQPFQSSNLPAPGFSVISVDLAANRITIKANPGWRAYREDAHGLPGALIDTT